MNWKRDEIERIEGKKTTQKTRQPDKTDSQADRDREKHSDNLYLYMYEVHTEEMSWIKSARLRYEMQRNERRMIKRGTKTLDV